MNLKDVVESNPVIISLSLVLGGSLSGIAAYDTILRVAHLETVASSELTERNQTIAQLRQGAIESAQTISQLRSDNTNLSYKIENETKLLSSEMLTQLEGAWINQDSKTGGITRFRIQRRGGDIIVHAWGQCQPTECDWGEQRALVDQDSAVLLWDQSFVFRKNDDSVEQADRFNGRLSIRFHRWQR